MEINGLLDKRAFELTDVSDMPKGVRIFGSRSREKPRPSSSLWQPEGAATVRKKGRGGGTLSE